MGFDGAQELLKKAFKYLNLKTVFGETYGCNTKGVVFWQRITDEHKGTKVMLPNRKFWNGQYYDGFYFSIDREDFNYAD